MDGLDFGLWHRAARDRAAALHLAPDSLLAAHARVCAYLGQEWLAREAEHLKRPQRGIGGSHPIFMSLRSQTDKNLLDVAELSVYLGAFQDDAAFSETLGNLRSASKYSATLYELAMAYRWKSAGARVRLAPVLQSGRVADFSAVIDGTEFIVEASIFPTSDFMSEPFRFCDSIRVSLSSCAPSETLAVELSISNLPSGDLHGVVQRGLKTSVNRLLKSGQGSVQVELPFGNLLVRHLQPDEDQGPPDEQWNLVAHGFLKARPKDGTVYNAHLEASVGRTNSIYVRVPRREGDLYDLLLKKYEKERRQMSSISQPRVILIDISGVKHDALTVDLPALQDSVGFQMVRHPAVSGVWLTTRNWMDANRMSYRAITMRNPTATVPLPKAFVRAVSEREYRYDVLTGEPITWSPSINSQPWPFPSAQ